MRKFFNAIAFYTKFLVMLPRIIRYSNEELAAERAEEGLQ